VAAISRDFFAMVRSFLWAALSFFMIAQDNTPHFPPPPVAGARALLAGAMKVTAICRKYRIHLPRWQI
jgi:drug/metabolite transporter (DMT)-like permease